MIVRCSSLALVVASLVMLVASPADAQSRRARAETPVETLAAANSAARQSPTRDGFVQARHVYAYQAGAIYEVYAHPSYVSMVLLEPGEALTDIAAGDTSRWMVTQAESETAEDPRTVVLVKPNASGLRTNIVLITDRRTYLIEAIAQSGSAYSAQIAWSYPRSETTAPVALLDSINLNYRIRTTRGARPAWVPMRVYDDGRRTWIEFPPDVDAHDLPPLFAVTGEGAELVNYRTLQGPSGQRYMIDRIFDIAELRLGTRSATIVRIERNPVDRVRTRSRHGARP